MMASGVNGLDLCFIKAAAGADSYVAGLRWIYSQLAIQHNLIVRPHLLPVIPPVVRKLWPATNQLIHTDVMGFPYYGNRVRGICSVYHLFDDLERCYPRSMPERFYHSTLKYYQDLTLHRADRVIGISRYTCQRLLELKGIKAECIYPFVDLDFYKPSTSVNAESNNKYKIFFAGNLSARKGADLLPAIMNALGEKFELRFTAGLRATKLKWLTSNMSPLGFLSQQQLLTEYQSCDAFLFPSRLEGFGYALAEAMACGRPVVASDCSSIPELVDHETNGLLCKAGCVDDFVEQIRRLAQNLDLARSLGCQAAEKIRIMCDKKTIIKKHKELIGMSCAI